MRAGVRKEWAWISGGLAFLSLLLGRRKTAGSLGALSAALGAWPSPRFSYHGKSVVVTGASRGLGLALAGELLRQGARVTLLARDARELDLAKARLEGAGRSRVYALTCDVTDDEQVARAIRLAHHHYGRIDMWINNAGAISVGPFEAMDDRDFEAQLNLHLRAVVRITRKLERYFRHTRSFRRGYGPRPGRIVNISSIGGVIPVPHMTPYCASKFALAGFSEAAAMELASKSVIVTTVYPGLMRTGSPIQAVFKGDAPKEYAWFALSDNTPGLSVPASRAARRILKAAAQGRHSLHMGWPAKLGAFGHANFPETFAAVMRFAAECLPRGESHNRRTGAASRGWVERRWWTAPLRWISEDSQRRLNQHPKSDPEFNLGR